MTLNQEKVLSAMLDSFPSLLLVIVICKQHAILQII